MFPMFKRKGKEGETKKIYIPVDLVLNYAAQGFSEQEITSRLQSQGFAPEYIDRALKMALKERVASTPGLETPQQPQPTLPQPTEFYGPASEPMISRRPPTPLGYPPERIIPPEEEERPPSLEDVRSSFAYGQPRQQIREPEPPMQEITIEELIEGIVNERWQEFEERLTDFDKRDLQLQSQIEDLRKKLKEINVVLAERDKGLAGKLDDFGESMENIESRIGSIEKVFKEILPDLTENIKAMSEVVEKIKEEKKESH